MLMLSEQTIRTIAQRYMEPIRNASSEERRFILENIIRETLIAEHALRQSQSIVPNAGCL